MQRKKALLIGAESLENKRIAEFLLTYGFETRIIFGVITLLEEVRSIKPDIIIVDRPVETDTFTDIMDILTNYEDLRLIPKILLLPHDDIVPALRQYETVIDEYVEKPLDYHVLISRVRTVEKWLAIVKGDNPATGLPGDKQIEAFVKNVIKRKKKFAYLSYTINNFLPFTLKHGYVEGDKAQREAVKIINETYEMYAPESDIAFVGQTIEGTIVSTVDLDVAEKIAQRVVNEFDKVIVGYYRRDERLKGGVDIKSQKGEKTYDMMTLTIYIAHNEKREFSSIFDIERILDQLRRKAIEPGSSVVVDRRTDKGNTFTVSKSTAERRALTVSPAVLIVDNDIDARMAIQNYLKLQGSTVYGANTINEALSILYENKCDVIISDVALPDGNGLEFLTRVKAIHALKLIPVIFLSSYAKKEIVLEAVKRGASRYLIKPVNNPDLYRNIYEVLVSK